MEALSREERKTVATNMRDIAKGRDVTDDRAWRFTLEANRYEKCGTEVVKWECPEDRIPFYAKTTCKSRICEDCSGYYVHRLIDRMEDCIKMAMANRRKGWFVSLLTLTVTTDRFGHDLPTQEDLRRFYRETRDWLRLYCGKYRGVFTKSGKVREDRRYWRGAASISTIEVGADNNNLHLHAVCYMPYTPQSKLKRDWHRITGDSYIVDIRAADNPMQAANYILKYINKPPQSDSYNRIAEYAWMIKGSRRVRTTGYWYNHLKLGKKERMRIACPYCDSKLKIGGLVELAYLDKRAQPLFDLLRLREEREGELLRYPLWHGIWGRGCTSTN